jgi:LysM repeat protein
VATPQPENPGPSPASGQLAVPAQELPKEFYHIVQPGENPYRISQNYGISTQNYFLWNGKQSWDEFDIHSGDKIIIKDPALAKPGSRTEVPPVQQPEAVASPSPVTPTVSAARDTVVITKTYTVKPKNTLFSISRANNMTVDEINGSTTSVPTLSMWRRCSDLAGTLHPELPDNSTLPVPRPSWEAKDVSPHRPLFARAGQGGV